MFENIGKDVGLYCLALIIVTREGEAALGRTPPGCERYYQDFMMPITTKPSHVSYI